MCDRLDKGTPIEELCADTKHLGGHHATARRVFYRRRFLQDSAALIASGAPPLRTSLAQAYTDGQTTTFIQRREQRRKEFWGLLGDRLWQQAIFQGSIGRDRQDF